MNDVRKQKKASNGVGSGELVSRSRGPRPMGNKLVSTLRRLQKLGWRGTDDRLTSPHTKIDYTFEQACRIEDVPVPNEKPGDAFHEWLFDRSEPTQHPISK